MENLTNAVFVIPTPVEYEWIVKIVFHVLFGNMLEYCEASSTNLWGKPMKNYQVGLLSIKLFDRSVCIWGHVSLRMKLGITFLEGMFK